MALLSKWFPDIESVLDVTMIPLMELVLFGEVTRREYWEISRLIHDIVGYSPEWAEWIHMLRAYTFKEFGGSEKDG